MMFPALLCVMTKRYGTPFVISDMMLDHTAERVAAAASGFAGVPVLRL